MGRKKLWDERILLPLTGEMLKRLDAVLEPDEARVDAAREALDRLIKRREKAKAKSS